MTQQAEPMIAVDPTRPTLVDDPTRYEVFAGRAQAPNPGVAPPIAGVGTWGPPSPPHGFGPMPTQAGPFPPAPAGWPGAPVPAPERSKGTLIAIVAAVGTVGLIAVVLLVGILATAFNPAPASTPAPAPSVPGVSAPAVPPSPSSVPSSDPTADRQATQRAFDAAGVRLDRARTVLDQRLTAAGRQGDMAGFTTASRDFQRELEIYKATVTGLTMPADQQAVYTGTLLPALDATISDATDMANAGSAAQLKSAAHEFDQHWTLVVNTHNQMDRALNIG